MLTIQCDKCNGKGKLPYRLAEGLCFQCNGTGSIQLDENKLKQIEIRNLEMAEHRKQVEAFEEEKRQKQLPQWNYTETMYKFRNRNESKMNEWEYNLISDMADKKYLRLSPKQKEILFKIINKFDPEVRNTIEGYFN